MSGGESEARAFYAEHYGPDTGWVVEELHLKVFVPTKDPGDSLALVREILDDAGFDIRVVPADA